MEWKIPVICYLWIMISLDKDKITNGYVFLSSNGSDYMKIGDSLELTCDAYEGSKYDDVRFYRRPYTSYSIDIFNTTSCIWMQSDLQRRYTVTCKEDRVFTLVQHNIQIEDHQTGWICERSGISNFFLVTVGVPVTTVQLAVFQENETTREFLCDTSPNGSRPPANFRWYKQRGHETPELIENHSIQNERQPVSVPGQAQADLVISYSTLTFSADSYQEIYIYCTASNLNNVDKDVQSNIQSTRDAEKEEEKHSTLTLTLVMICVSGLFIIFVIVVISAAIIKRRGRRFRSTADEAILEGHSNHISEQRTVDEEQANEHQDSSDQRPYTITTALDTTAKNYDRGTIEWYLKILTHPNEDDNTASLPVARGKSCI